jgi:class 3 adenylate cyclase
LLHRRLLHQLVHQKLHLQCHSHWSLSNIYIDGKCGINTALVLVGLLRSGERDQFTVIGTHVNLASRLEGRAEEGEIIISSFTMAKVQGKFHAESIAISHDDDKIKSFKGISEYYKVLDKVT